MLGMELPLGMRPQGLFLQRSMYPGLQPAPLSKTTISAGPRGKGKGRQNQVVCLGWQCLLHSSPHWSPTSLLLIPSLFPSLVMNFPNQASASSFYKHLI